MVMVSLLSDLAVCSYMSFYLSLYICKIFMSVSWNSLYRVTTAQVSIAPLHNFGLCLLQCSHFSHSKNLFMLNKGHYCYIDCIYLTYNPYLSSHYLQVSLLGDAFGFFITPHCTASLYIRMPSLQYTSFPFICLLNFILSYVSWILIFYLANFSHRFCFNAFSFAM